MFVRFLAADVGFVGLDDAAQESATTAVVVIVLARGFADALQHEPGRFLRDANLLGQLQGANPFARGNNEVNGIKPLIQGDMRTFEDRSSANREGLAALSTTVVPANPVPALLIHLAMRAAVRAFDSICPTSGLNVLASRFFVWELL